jgi:hypothetical protein
MSLWPCKKSASRCRGRANAGSAGALARKACAARSLPEVHDAEAVRAARSGRAGAPAFPVHSARFKSDRLYAHKLSLCHSCRLLLIVDQNGIIVYDARGLTN